MKVPDNCLVYYGWLNSFNSATNAWNNEKVAQDLAKYNVLVLGDGVQDPAHGDYANTKVIIPRIFELHPEIKIFGYVTTNQSIDDFKKKSAWWNILEISGIFMDESGYDFGKNRKEFNERVCYVHYHMCKPVMVNAWKPEHVLSHDPKDDDPSYPNSTYNPENVSTAMNCQDWYMLESFAIGQTGNYEAHSQWFDRGNKAWEYEVKRIGISVIPDGDVNGQAKFDFGYTSSLMFLLEAYGTSDTNYGAGSAASKMWVRPDISQVVCVSKKPAVVKDAASPVYYAYKKNARLKLDFTAGTEVSAIELY